MALRFQSKPAAFVVLLSALGDFPQKAKLSAKEVESTGFSVNDAVERRFVEPVNENGEPIRYATGVSDEDTENLSTALLERAQEIRETLKAEILGELQGQTGTPEMRRFEPVALSSQKEFTDLQGEVRRLGSDLKKAQEDLKKATDKITALEKAPKNAPAPAVLPTSAQT